MFCLSKLLPKKVSSQDSEAMAEREKEKRKRLRYDFLESPSLRFFCSLCHDILFDPQVSTCCNVSYCEPCIKQLKINEEPCPTCSNKRFPTRPDPSIKEELDALRVHCINNGCHWIGRVKDLEQHLNNLTGDCGYSLVSCRNNCGMTFIRKDAIKHVCNDSNLTETRLVCPCTAIGCTSFDNERRKGYSLSRHITDNMEEHLQLLTRYAQSLKEREDAALVRESNIEKEIEDALREKDGEIAQLKERLKELSVLLETKENEILDLNKDVKAYKRASTLFTEDRCVQQKPKYNTFERHFVMRDFNLYYQPNAGKLVWDSEPFFTHDKGYKMSFSVDVVFGSLRVSLYLLRGEYDESLLWPLQGSMNILLLNQVNNRNHYSYNFIYDDNTLEEIGDRVKPGRIKSDKNVSTSQKLSYDNLLMSSARSVCYLKNNSLVFTVSYINLK